MIAVTGASGQLGRLVIEQLLAKTEPSQLVALVRTPEKVADLQQKGVVVRAADYAQPDTLLPALQGVKKLLLISSSEVGQRSAQHVNVINAAKQAGVELLAYTSLLHADTSPLPLRFEHLDTEKAIKESGLPAVILRNGWYTENYAGAAPSAFEHGAVFGCAGEGKIASAARADYAAAAAVVLLSADQAGRVYELAGDESYTLKDFADEIAKQSGKAVEYKNLTQSEYFDLLKNGGLPEPIAAMLSESDNGAAQGGLFDDSKQLSQLIGRPTTLLTEVLKGFLL
ncbi:SDR family oxidoreductase [Desulfogranum japonicum]|uniref:SDR family oxidoreductase n=1 Tax=Desulfogranum japonicum TaxID=231447 RepID=UPI0004138F9E|nr:SDR family oxidoreductase [Desulfogranum japonicum]